MQLLRVISCRWHLTHRRRELKPPTNTSITLAYKFRIKPDLAPRMVFIWLTNLMHWMDVKWSQWSLRPLRPLRPLWLRGFWSLQQPLLISYWIPIVHTMFSLVQMEWQHLNAEQVQVQMYCTTEFGNLDFYTEPNVPHPMIDIWSILEFWW